MSDKSDSGELSPPYAPFGTLTNFIGTLSKTATPPVIDRSVMPKMSGGAQKTLLSTLKFLKLVGPAGQTTDALRRAVKAYSDPAEWKNALSDILSDAYSTIVGDLDLDAGSSKQLYDAFREKGGVDGQMLKKSVRFYIKAMKEADLIISPHFTVRNAGGNATKRASGPRPGAKAKVPPGGGKAATETVHKGQHSPEAGGKPLVMALLDKFPNFDPGWGPDQQTAWFAAYQKLLGMGGAPTN